jgi:hypothetical protein
MLSTFRKGTRKIEDYHSHNTAANHGCGRNEIVSAIASYQKEIFEDVVQMPG